MKISKKSTKPLHKQVKEMILEECLEGSSPGAKLPTELELSKKLRIGRKPVRKAFEELQKEGIVGRKAGIGTFYIGKGKTCLNAVFYDDQADFEYIFDMYEELNSNVKFNKINLGVPLGYPRQVMDMISREEIDVVLMTGSLFHCFDAKKSLLPLNDYPGVYRNSTYECPWRAFKHSRTSYAVPIAFSPVVMAYRKDLFDQTAVAYPEVGWDWDTFLEKAISLSSGKGVMDEEKRYGFLFINGINRWPAFLYQNGGGLRNRQGEIDLSGPECKEAMNFIYDIFHKWKVSPFLENKGGLIPFTRANIAMIPISYIQLKSLREVKHFDWDIAPLPRKKNSSTIVISYGFAAAANSRKLGEVYSFFDFCQSEVVQKRIAETKSLLPVLEDVVSEDKSLKPKSYGIFKELIPDMVHLNLPHNGNEEGIIIEETSMLWADLQTYEEACEHIKRRINNLTPMELLNATAI